MKTYSTKAADIFKQWHVIDASGMVLGRLACEAAKLLRGKHKPIFAPHLDVGDAVIVINADKVRVTGKKAAQKTYWRHSQYPHGLKSITYDKLAEAHPTRAVEHAIRGMLPRNRLGAQMYRHLKVYAGPSHPHEAQLKAKPEPKAASAEVAPAEKEA